VNRSAAQWLRLEVAEGGASLEYSTHERIRDDAASNPYWYYFPSLMVNQVGDMVIAFSGSKATEFIGAFFSGRRNSGTTLPKPVLVQAGKAYHSITLWGDYSSTCLDPTDAMTFWTVQQYAEDPVVVDPAWGTWVSKINKNP
jgi:hypothetical protein